MIADDLQGRTVMVTGANSGIGRATVEALADRGAAVVLVCRSAQRGGPVVEAIRNRRPAVDPTLIELNLANLGAVRAAAAAYLASGRPLDVLINNAGVAGTASLSPEGFDLTYAVNHLGPFLLTELLLPRLQQAPQGRIVNVASSAHYRVTTIDWTVLERRAVPKRSGFADYAVTKLMNVLHAAELARRLAGTRVTTYALHPGVVASNIWRGLPGPLQWVMKRFMVTNEEGALTQIYCATAPELATVSGRFYDRSREREPSRTARDPALARELWTRTEAAIASVG